METKMLRWTVGVTRLDRIRNDETHQRLGVAPIADKLREARLRWYDHVLRASGDSVRKMGFNTDVLGKQPKKLVSTPNKRLIVRSGVTIPEAGQTLKKMTGQRFI
ncbi:unnamed protein product [Heligmosomoides polygyrus]|uniref:Reverse transcriptase n=1 Tax=Heligmosomoides polygyrus TaxID=6339 RepID=A0A183FGM7_HELPZ|nr:unnamed protein product [Heligmosomoides polygyrus]